MKLLSSCLWYTNGKSHLFLAWGIHNSSSFLNLLGLVMTLLWRSLCKILSHLHLWRFSVCFFPNIHIHPCFQPQTSFTLNEISVTVGGFHICSHKMLFITPLPLGNFPVSKSFQVHYHCQWQSYVFTNLTVSCKGLIITYSHFYLLSAHPTLSNTTYISHVWILAYWEI